MNRITRWALPALMSAVLACPAVAAGQDDEDRDARLRAIERAIERLEAVLSEELGDGDLSELAAQITELEGLDILPQNELEALQDLELRMFRPGRYFLGVQIGESEDGGVTVEAVLPDSPAEAAGFLAGDVIVAAGEAEISSIEQLIEAVNENGDEKAMSIVLFRGDVKLTIEVTPEEREGELPLLELRENLVPHLLEEGELELRPRIWRNEEGGELRLELVPEILEAHGLGGAHREQMESLRAELEELRNEMAEQREEMARQMEQLREQIAALREALRDRDN